MNTEITFNHNSYRRNILINGPSTITTTIATTTMSRTTTCTTSNDFLLILIGTSINFMSTYHWRGPAWAQIPDRLAKKILVKQRTAENGIGVKLFSVVGYPMNRMPFDWHPWLRIVGGVMEKMKMRKKMGMKIKKDC